MKNFLEFLGVALLIILLIILVIFGFSCIITLFVLLWGIAITIWVAICWVIIWLVNLIFGTAITFTFETVIKIICIFILIAIIRKLLM